MDMPSARLVTAVLLLQRIRAAHTRAPRADEQFLARRRRLLRFTALALVLSMGPWFLYFVWQQQAVVALVYGLGLLLALWQYRLIQQGRPLLATAVLSLTAWIAIAAVATWLDRPYDGLPRSIGFMCLPLVLAQRFLLQDQAPALRRTVQGLSLGLLAFWSAAPDLLSTPRLMPDQHRALAQLLTVLTAAGLSAWSLHLEQLEAREHVGLALDLAQAVAAGRLQLHLQPQVDARGQVLGAEALVRWTHPRLGPISPGQFVPLAECHGLIVPLGEWVLRRACTLARIWQHDPALRGLTLAVNVSAPQILDPAAFERLLDLVRAAELPQGVLKFELTESVFAAQAEPVRERLTRCRELGIATSLDDFGTGYSSLSYLTDLPFDQLKIDQSFVKGLGREPRSQRIAETVVALGQRLGMAVIAEGVESAEQREALLAMGCTQFQGYWFSKPLPETVFIDWVYERQPGAPAATLAFA